MRLLFSIPMDNGPRPAIFLDRDGVINERIVNGYVRTWEDFKFVDGMSDAVASWARLGLPIIVVSNQACVGKGLIDAPYLQEITRRFVAELAAAGARVDAVYYCPHRSDEHCECRKPRPGLLREASRDWHIDLSQSVLVGDSSSDLEAADAVQCRAILFDSACEAAPEMAARVSEMLETSKYRAEYLDGAREIARSDK